MTGILKRASPTQGVAIMVGLGITGVAWMSHGPHLTGLDEEVMPDMVGPILVAEGRPIWVQRFEVTVAEWIICHDAGGCALRMLARAGDAAASTPATGISYPDAREYVDWLNSVTRGSFRLPSVAEWGFVASSVMPDAPDPFFSDPSLSWASAYPIDVDIPRTLRPSGSFSTTAEGISDLDGSVWEWTDDCYSRVNESSSKDRCPAYYVAGLHIAAMSFLERDPARGGCAVGLPPAHLGLRLFSEIGRAHV